MSGGFFLFFRFGIGNGLFLLYFFWWISFKFCLDLRGGDRDYVLKEGRANIFMFILNGF